MADVRPFRGLRYNSGVVGDLSTIVSPPFDTIPAALQISLHERNPYNVVRLELGDQLGSDTSQNSRYTRSAATMADWLARQALVRDAQPAYYLVQHAFKIQGRERARLELMAATGLEDYQRKVVLPHEYTRDEDKRDRLALMQACRANISPIMCLYRDQRRVMGPIFELTMSEPPLMDLSDPGGQDYRAWKIDDLHLTGQISAAMASGPLYIADGHHRYETALAYRDLMASGPSGEQKADAAPNFVMMGLIEFDDPGLMLLPHHRLVGGLGDGTLSRIRDGLRTLFDSEPYSQDDARGVEGLVEEVEIRGKVRPAMGLLDPGAGGYQLLTVRQDVDLESGGPLGSSDSWILEERLLKPVLGDNLERYLTYTHEGHEAEERVMGGQQQLAFFLKPFPLDLFETLMNMGQRLPPKSTYFYPKLATGLVINPLEGTI